MEYFSTNNPDLPVTLRQAVMRSIAADGGVYMPRAIPMIPKALFKNIADMSIKDIGYVAATSMFAPDIDPSKINDIVKETLSFPVELREIAPNRYALELFHGPTGSFKDVGARFMARVVRQLMLQSDGVDGRLHVFVATSGDTGCAVAHGFANIDNVDVHILHPKGQSMRATISDLHGVASNIHPIAIRGNFDQCQQIVKEIYNDPDLNKQLNITSANSINIARLLPQTFYFFYAYARILAVNPEASRIAIATPCGNLGNLTAALFSYQMGLPITRILAAGHDNERLWGRIDNGRLLTNDFTSRSLNTNAARINTLFKNNPALANMIECHTFNDSDIIDQIRSTYTDHHYLMDRNTAMACRAMQIGLKEDETGVFLATASPQKYAGKLRSILDCDIELQQNKTDTEHKPHHDRQVFPPLLPAIKRYLLDNFK